MSRSAGTYTAPSNSWNPAVEGTGIDETDWNSILDDVEAALTESTYTAGTSATDNAVIRADGTDGRKVQTSALIVDDSGNATGLAKVTMSGALINTEGALTLANGANSDVALPAATFVTITGPSGAFSVTGFASPTNGQLLELYNSTSQNMTITNDATSTAANRILTLTGADVALTGTSLARFRYSAASSRWILTGTQG